MHSIGEQVVVPSPEARARIAQGLFGGQRQSVGMWLSFWLVMGATLLALVGAAHATESSDQALRFSGDMQSDVLDARLAGDLERTRIVIDVAGPLAPNVFVLPEPNRLVIDLPETGFGMLGDRQIEARGLVSALRYGPFAPGRGRIVIDLAEPVKIDELLVLAPLDNQPARFVLDLVRSDETGFAQEVERTRDAFLASVEAPKENRLDIAPDRGRPIIVLDPGHGGIDSGAVSRSGVLEKNVVLEFSRRLAEQLRAGGLYSVHMTRSDDVFIPLASRVRFAQTLHADLFISIHADSLVRHRDMRGATVYTLSDRASDEIARQLVANEARSEMLAGMDVREPATSDVADILIDLTRRETTRFSLAFAETVVGELSTATRMVNNPHRSAGFRVLKAPDIPSLLLELGFLSNEEDVQLLTDEAWRARTIDSLETAIHRFFEQRVASAP